ncbi:MAG: hypothetical protein H0U12_11035 [Thermoleophilaceae bacterium]|nr:hypothetical protein [Thermoleophilaceae bacterium]
MAPPYAEVQRVAVIGCGGAGKSNLARALGRQLGLPVVHLDEHYWSPGWQRADPAAWRARHAHLVGAGSWVIDGNYLSALDVRLSAADTVLFLDLAAWRCAWRATWRVAAGRGQANTAPGCPERLDRRHLRFLRYIVWEFPRKSRPRILRELAEHAATTAVVRLTSPRQVRRGSLRT